VDPGFDDDDAPVEAIAITAASVSNGTFEFSTNGTDFHPVVGVSETQSLLLDDTDKLRFVPNADFFGNPGTLAGNGSFKFRAWDQRSVTGSSTAATADVATGTKVDTSTNGGTSEFSSNERAANIIVDSVDDAPTATIPNLTDSRLTVLEDAGAQTINGFVTNLDDQGSTFESGQTLSFALTHLSGTDNTTLFSAQPVLTVDGSDPTRANLTWTPATDANTGDTEGPSVFRVTLNDTGSLANGGANSTILTSNLQFVVTSQNDAPVLENITPVLSVDEDQSLGSNTGTTIAALIADGSITEAKDAVNPGLDDDDTPVKAIAITSASVSNGTFEFSHDGGAFEAVVVSATQSLLLDDTDKL
ncbi:uncharacterized protein METZ01_LOCUS320918, partial [marine metagenome]